MSNELQQKYPKFYESPYLFVGNLMVRDNKSIWYENDTKFDGYLCAKCFDYMDIQDFTPLFKPQEGEAFIKDLEDAVSAATGKKYLYREEKHGQHILNTGTSPEDKVVRMPIINLALVKGYELESGIRLDYFDTAAYLDTLRKLGYYL